MGYAVRMPQLGMTMEEGLVVEWPIEEGESFEAGEVIAVVESEKTTNDVEAREAATMIEQFVDYEQPVGPGVPIAYVGDSDEEVPDDIRAELDGGSAPEPAESNESQPQATPEPSSGGAGSVEVKVSPRARSYAAEQDLSSAALEGIEGTGPEGAIVEKNVIDAVAAGIDTDSAGIGSAARPSVDGRGIYEERSGSQLRRTIANRMTASAKEAPQVTLNRRVSVESLLSIKERLAEDLNQNVSVTDFVLAALVGAIREYPEFNGLYEDGVHKLASHVNIGVAVDIEDGLVTPVLKGAEQLDIFEIGDERSRIVSLAKEKSYTADDLGDGTITVSNLGPLGVESFDPILNPPEVAILGIDAIGQGVDPDSGEIVPQLGLSLTFDHRAVDGADAARFLGAIVDELTHPLGLVSLGSTSADEGSEEGSFREVGDEGESEGDRTAVARSSGGMNATVQSRRFEWDVDEPETHGGDDSAPTPVEQFLGSLSSCLTLMIGNMADRRGIDVESVDVTSQAAPEDGQIERIDVSVTIASEADQDDIERVVQTAERACYVNQVIDDDIERSLELTIE